MNAWLLRAPWWKLAAVMGALIAPFFVLLFALTGDRSWTAAALMGLGVGVVCAPVLGYITANQIQDSMAASGSLSESDRVAVERAARRGPVPEDDALREAALRVVEDRLIALRVTRVRARATAVSLLLVAAALAVVRSPWWWIGVVLCVGLLVSVLMVPARLQRRAEMLRRGGRREGRRTVRRSRGPTGCSDLPPGGAATPRRQAGFLAGRRQLPKPVALPLRALLGGEHGEAVHPRGGPAQWVLVVDVEQRVVRAVLARRACRSSSSRRLQATLDQRPRTTAGARSADRALRLDVPGRHPGWIMGRYPASFVPAGQWPPAEPSRTGWAATRAGGHC